MTDDLARVQRCDVRERAEGHDKYSRLLSQAGEAGVAGDVRTCVKLNTKAIEIERPHPHRPRNLLNCSRMPNTSTMCGPSRRKCVTLPL